MPPRNDFDESELAELNQIRPVRQPIYTQEEHDAALELAFHRGVDAAKEAIRFEVDRIGVEEGSNGRFFAGVYINAIARKCGFDRKKPLQAVLNERERCAKIADNMYDNKWETGYRNAGITIAAAIREEPNG